MKSRISDLSIEYIRSILDYNEKTGVVTWKSRTPDMFTDLRRNAEHQCKLWNSKHAGKPAGYVCYKKSCEYSSMYIRLKNSNWVLSRIIWFYVTGEWPNGEIDHIDGDSHNNSWVNLRDVTHFQNMQNRKMLKTNTSGRIGVYRYKQNRFRAIICFNGRRINLGIFDTLDDASLAYSEASKVYRGHFARVD